MKISQQELDHLKKEKVITHNCVNIPSNDEYELYMFKPSINSSFSLGRDNNFYIKNDERAIMLFDKNQVGYLQLRVKALSYASTEKKEILKEFLEYQHRRNYIFPINIKELFESLGVTLGINLIREVCVELGDKTDKHGFKKQLQKEFKKSKPPLKPTFCYGIETIKYDETKWHDVPMIDCRKPNIGGNN